MTLLLFGLASTSLLPGLISVTSDVGVWLPTYTGPFVKQDIIPLGTEILISPLDEVPKYT